ncbi:hypothetical protein [Solwaraspora sp. WMMA2101]|uniref:hypothetical protein n=1 Tax=Solwaraspora sp. WMMA2101 TaxID=3404124 RepID=UPI003B94E382
MGSWAGSPTRWSDGSGIEPEGERSGTGWTSSGAPGSAANWADPPSRYAEVLPFTRTPRSGSTRGRLGADTGRVLSEPVSASPYPTGQGAAREQAVVPTPRPAPAGETVDGSVQRTDGYRPERADGQRPDRADGHRPDRPGSDDDRTAPSASRDTGGDAPRRPAEPARPVPTPVNSPPRWQETARVVPSTPLRPVPVASATPVSPAAPRPVRPGTPPGFQGPTGAGPAIEDDRSPRRPGGGDSRRADGAPMRQETTASADDRQSGPDPADYGAARADRSTDRVTRPDPGGPGTGQPGTAGPTSAPPASEAPAWARPSTSVGAIRQPTGEWPRQSSTGAWPQQPTGDWDRRGDAGDWPGRSGADDWDHPRAGDADQPQAGSPQVGSEPYGGGAPTSGGPTGDVGPDWSYGQSWAPTQPEWAGPDADQQWTSQESAGPRPWSDGPAPDWSGPTSQTAPASPHGPTPQHGPTSPTGPSSPHGPTAQHGPSAQHWSDDADRGWSPPEQPRWQSTGPTAESPPWPPAESGTDRPWPSATDFGPAGPGGFGPDDSPPPPAPDADLSTPIAAAALDSLPQRVPADPDVPTVPQPPAVEPSAETPELARIASHLRRGDSAGQPQERPEGFDVNAILAAVRGVGGVRDASLRTTEAGAHSLRLDLSEGADPAEVSRMVARLLQERMGLAAAPQNLPGADLGGGLPALPTRGRASAPLPPAPPPAAAPGWSHPEPADVPRRRRPGQRPQPEYGDPPPTAPAEPAAVSCPDTSTAPASGPPRPLNPGGRPGPRVVLDHVQVSTFGVDATVEVRLTAGPRTTSGVATGPAVDGYVLRLCAVAAASAIEELLTGPAGAFDRGRCFVEHAAVVPMGGCEVAVVVVLLACGGWVEQLAGSAVVSGDPRQAVVRATLAAVNRRLDALLA